MRLFGSTPASPALHHAPRPTLIRLPDKGFRGHAEDFMLCRPSTAGGRTAIAFMCWTMGAVFAYFIGQFIYALLTGGYAS